MASDRIRTQAYTAVICIADRSVTDLPAIDPPVKNVYALPAVRFEGLSLDRKSPEKMLTLLPPKRRIIHKCMLYSNKRLIHLFISIKKGVQNAF